jgi:histidinol dehydrogenase
MRRTTFQHLNKEALLQARGPVGIMSEAEGFADKHGVSVNVRFEE